jgi:HPt (histidine-containing phosphotransfer) domain-containing protein
MTKTKQIQNPVIDIEFLRGIIENDKEFERELFEIFVDNAKKNIEKLEEAIAVNDGNGWYMASHAFKGAATSVGAFELAKVLEDAQQSPEENNTTKKTILGEVKEQFELVLDYINHNIIKK